jgi:hypothetical protein
MLFELGPFVGRGIAVFADGTGLAPMFQVFLNTTTALGVRSTGRYGMLR